MSDQGKAVCKFGHEHDSPWAALRCTKSRRAGDVAAIKLGRKIQKALAKPEERTGDPFAGFR